MTTEELLQKWAEFISPLLRDFGEMMNNGPKDLPNDLNEAIIKASEALGDVGLLLVKYAPNQEGANDG